MTSIYSGLVSSNSFNSKERRAGGNASVVIIFFFLFIFCLLVSLRLSVVKPPQQTPVVMTVPVIQVKEELVQVPVVQEQVPDVFEELPVMVLVKPVAVKAVFVRQKKPVSKKPYQRVRVLAAAKDVVDFANTEQPKLEAAFCLTHQPKGACHGA